MRSIFSKTVCLLSVLLFFATICSAQPSLQDTIDHSSHHHTPWDILSGDGDDSIVCYKQAHRNMYFLVTGLIIIIALVAIKLLQLNRKTNKMLQVKNEIIEEKNKSITDSINYAKRLQNAILPPDMLVKQALPDSFIVYEPKDIVSGDFYWVSEHEGQSLIAAIDCTGHGVPGALLSIVGHNAINKAVNEERLNKPSAIIESMNISIRKVLHQDKSSDIRDGMDMALCSLNTRTGELQYAGANNPLYIISEGKLRIVKASKLTVGSMTANQELVVENNIFQLKAGDAFYIFSDGYADQFGGADNKKFKASRLQELLLAIHKKPMEEQKKLIMSAFRDWKGNYEQVDDVLVIGARI
jgi:serine phosphatase RsbU (regulator of sigma subunit)